MKRPSKRKVKVQSAFVEMSSVFVMLRDISGKARTFCSSPGLGDGSICLFIYGAWNLKLVKKVLSFQA